MGAKCANRYCSTTRQHDEGKLFRLDLDLGSKTGGSEQTTEYMWLCSSCAQRMHPRVDFNGSTITVRLAANVPMVVADPNASSLSRPGARVN
jgi:hypothetical protein